jgi:osmotically-inducible protein OsmY
MRRTPSETAGPRITVPWPDDRTPSPSAVRDALSMLDDVDLADLHIMLDGGRATIDGSVVRDVDRDRVLRAIVALPGVSSVVDRLRLRS